MEEVPRGTLLVPLASPCFVLGLTGVETEGLWIQTTRGGLWSFPLCGGTFTRSHSVSRMGFLCPWTDRLGDSQGKLPFWAHNYQTEIPRTLLENMLAWELWEILKSPVFLWMEGLGRDQRTWMLRFAGSEARLNLGIWECLCWCCTLCEQCSLGASGSTFWAMRALIWNPDCQELSGTPNHCYFLKSIDGTNGRRTSVQIEGVLQYELEVYCGISLSS